MFFHVLDYLISITPLIQFLHLLEIDYSTIFPYFKISSIFGEISGFLKSAEYFWGITYWIFGRISKAISLDFLNLDWKYSESYAGYLQSLPVLVISGFWNRRMLKKRFVGIYYEI